MFLFGGTFFPLETLANRAQVLAHALPLTHRVTVARALAVGSVKGQLLVNLLYLILFSAITFIFAILLMKRRLIK
jgi:lipooligosaccharide transport system permease protein